MKKTITLLFVLFSTFLFSQTFNGTVGAIPDDGTTTDFTLSVFGLSPAVLNATNGLVSINLDITHPYNSDLNVSLIAPDGTLINLFSGIGGDGDNFTNTVLNQSVTNSIASGVSPFSGTYKPQ